MIRICACTAHNPLSADIFYRQHGADDWSFYAFVTPQLAHYIFIVACLARIHTTTGKRTNCWYFILSQLYTNLQRWGFFFCLCLLCWYAINTCHIWMHSRCVCVCVLTFDISAIYLSVCVLVVYFEEFIIITLPYGGVKCGFLKCESDWLIKKYTIVEYIHTLTLGINIFTMTSLFFFLITSYHVSYSFFILKDKVVLL